MTSRYDHIKSRTIHLNNKVTPNTALKERIKQFKQTIKISEMSLCNSTTLSVPLVCLGMNLEISKYGCYMVCDKTMSS